MSLQNLTLKEIDSFLGGTTPFPRQPHKGIFRECVGEVTADYNGKQITVSDIEAAVFNNWRLSESAFETLELFAWRFTEIWNRNFQVLTLALVNAPEFNLNEESEKIEEDTMGTRDITRNYTDNSHSEGTNSADATRDYSNTPNQLVENTFKGLTDRTHTTDSNKGNSQSESTGSSSANESHTVGKGITRSKQSNITETWLRLYEKIDNIIYQFADKFAPCFTRTITLKDYPHNYRGVRPYKF